MQLMSELVLALSATQSCFCKPRRNFTPQVQDVKDARGQKCSKVELFCSTFEKSFSRRKNACIQPSMGRRRFWHPLCHCVIPEARLLEKVRGDFLGRRWVGALVLSCLVISQAQARRQRPSHAPEASVLHGIASVMLKAVG